MGCRLSFFWLPAFFASLIVLFSVQVAFPQVLQLEAKDRIRVIQERNQVLEIIQLQRLNQRQQIILGGANFRQARISINYRLENEQLPAMKRRLEAHLLSQNNWIDHHCQLTPAQSDRFNELINQSLGKYSIRWNSNFLLPTASDLLPVTFVINGLGQKKFDAPTWHKEIDSLLTDAQQAALKNARRARDARLKFAIRDHAYAELDGLLYFSPQQRPVIEQRLELMIAKSKSNCFSISDKKLFFPYAYTTQLLAGVPSENFSPSQVAMLNLTRSNLPQATKWNLLLTQSDSPEEFNKKIDQLAERMREELFRQVIVHFDCLSAYLDLNAVDARRLEVAAKGAVHYKVNESRNSALQSYRIAEARMKNARPGIARSLLVTFPRPETDSVLSHPIIQEIEKSLAEEFESYFEIIARNEHEARVTYLVSLLDRELWLTQTQHEAFTELITSRMAVKPISAPDHIYEIVLLAFALTTISDQEISEFLSQSQLATWKELQTHFEFSDDPSVDDSASLKLPRANEKIAFNVPELRKKASHAAE